MTRRGNGEGSIRKLKKGLWEGRYSVGKDENDKLVRRAVYASKKEVCEAKLKVAIEATKAQSGLFVAADMLTVDEWMKKYIWDIKKPNVKPMTFEDYERNWRLYIKPAKISSMKILEVRKWHFREFVDELLAAGASPFTIRNVYGVLRNAFNTAEKRGIIPVSYANNVELPKRRAKPTVILTQEQQKAFMEAVKGHRMEAAFIIAATTGIREGELAALMWEDYDGSNLSITKDAVRVNIYDPETHEKTGSEVIIQDTPKTDAGVRSIPLMPIAKEALRVHKMAQNDEKVQNRELYKDNDKGLIFCNEVGLVYEPRYYRNLLHKLLDAAGLPRKKFHALRHTFATRGLEAGLSPKELQELMGHETPEMVMHYQHLLEKQARTAIDKMAKYFEW